ncbi:MAG: PRC-barrel domain-containing protein [Gemmatimonadaceae bacterium]
MVHKVGRSDLSPDSASLRHLSDLDDYTIAKGNPDIRGWSVRTADARPIGAVMDVLVDTGAARARYIDVELNRSILGLDDLRHVLLPIGVARIDKSQDTVYVNIAAADVPALPPYSLNTRLDRDYERALVRFFAAGEAASQSLADEEFYHGEHFNERRLLERRCWVPFDHAYVTRRASAA